MADRATERPAGRAGSATSGLHRRLLGELACLHEVEQWPAGDPAALSGWVRVAAWNVLRGRRPWAGGACENRAPPSASSPSSTRAWRGPERRYDRRDRPDVGAGHVYGVEFVELGWATNEQRAAAGADNERGLHGNAIVSPR